MSAEVQWSPLVTNFGSAKYIASYSPLLTNWDRLTHICVDKLTIIGSHNGLSPGRRQAITWTNVGILLIGTLGTNVGEIFSGIQTFLFKKMHLKMSSAKWRPCCLGLNVLTRWRSERGYVSRILSDEVKEVGNKCLIMSILIWTVWTAVPLHKNTTQIDKIFALNSSSLKSVHSL